MWSPGPGGAQWSPCAVCGGRRQITCSVCGGTGQLPDGGPGVPANPPTAPPIAKWWSALPDRSKNALLILTAILVAVYIFSLF
jgi:hypothetical protein